MSLNSSFRKPIWVGHYKKRSNFMHKIKRAVLLILCVFLPINLTACCDDLLATMANALDSYVKEKNIYEYYASFKALVESDYEIIEKRLKSLDFKIVGKEYDGDSITYCLHTYYAEEDEYFQDICTTSVFVLTDENGNEIITHKDVNSALYERVGVAVGVSETIREDLAKYANVFFVMDDKSIEGYIFTKKDENGNTVILQTKPSEDLLESQECKRALIYCAMFLGAAPLKDVVTVNVIQSATKISPADDS